MNKKFNAHVEYDTPLFVPVDDKGAPQVQHIEASLVAFGANNIKFHFTPYTGAGKHEWLKSSDPGLTTVRCIKCLCKQTPANENANDCKGEAD